MKKSLINCNPIQDSVYTWKNVKVDFGSDFSKIQIEQDGKKIYVNGSFFTDVNIVINNAIKENNYLLEKSLINTIGTSLALPNIQG